MHEVLEPFWVGEMRKQIDFFGRVAKTTNRRIRKNIAEDQDVRFSLIAAYAIQECQLRIANGGFNNDRTTHKKA